MIRRNIKNHRISGLFPDLTLTKKSAKQEKRGVFSEAPRFIKRGYARKEVK